MEPLDVDAPAPPVLVAAMGPVLLRPAGTLADGTTTWMTGPATVGAHITPTITAAAGGRRPATAPDGGRAPGLCHADAVAARARADKVFAIYGRLPSYRAMLDREGHTGPGDVGVVGVEESVAAQLRAGRSRCHRVHRDPFGTADERARTVAVVTALANGTAG